MPIVPLFRLIYLQLYFVIWQKRFEYSWINNLKLPIYKSETGLTGNFYFGLHEFNDMSFMINLLRRDEIFFDVGANLGSYSLLASGVAGAKSIAFEPVPTTFLRLNENIKINKLENRVITRMIAITSPDNLARNGDLYFSIDKHAENSFVDLNYHGKKIKINASTLDMCSLQFNPTLIKIDVEGHEPELLKGAENTFKSTSLLAVIIENQSQGVTEFFKQLNFIAISYQGLNRAISLINQKSANQIWVPMDKLPVVKRRVFEAPRNSLMGREF